jgi:hypothetical protein
MTLHLAESSVFPLELYDEIIGHLHDDIVALASCAVVSRSWLRFSNYHISNQREIYERNAADLARLLIPRRCWITSNGAVCHLHIRGNSGLYSAALQIVEDRIDSIRLRQLSIVNLQEGDNFLILNLLPFGMVRELYISKHRFSRVEGFISLLLAFPHLRRLEIDWSYAAGDCTSFSIDKTICERPVVPNLQVFKIVGGLVQPLLHSLSLSPNCGVRDISIRKLRSRDIPRVCEFVKRLGSHLEHMELGLVGLELSEELGEQSS